MGTFSHYSLLHRFRIHFLMRCHGNTAWSLSDTQCCYIVPYRQEGLHGGDVYIFGAFVTVAV
jgi:hypothetical protein